MCFQINDKFRIVVTREMEKKFCYFYFYVSSYDTVLFFLNFCRAFILSVHLIKVFQATKTQKSISIRGNQVVYFQTAFSQHISKVLSFMSFMTRIKVVLFDLLSILSYLNLIRHLVLPKTAIATFLQLKLRLKIRIHLFSQKIRLEYHRFLLNSDESIPYLDKLCVSVENSYRKEVGLTLLYYHKGDLIAKSEKFKVGSTNFSKGALTSQYIF